jgi:hypothetical protein
LLKLTIESDGGSSFRQIVLASESEYFRQGVRGALRVVQLDFNYLILDFVLAVGRAASRSFNFDFFDEGAYTSGSRGLNDWLIGHYIGDIGAQMAGEGRDHLCGSHSQGGGDFGLTLFEITLDGLRSEHLLSGGVSPITSARSVANVTIQRQVVISEPAMGNW